MELSSNRFKALAVTLGFSLWFFIITSALGLFTIEALILFFVILLGVTQIFSKKLIKLLDAFAIFNTKVFLGIIYIFIISPYGIIMRFLSIDLLRLKQNDRSYWLKIEELKTARIFKQY